MRLTGIGPNVPQDTRSSHRAPLRVSLLVLPEASVGSLTGMYDTLSGFPLLSTFDRSLPTDPPFAVELVAATHGPQAAKGGTLPLRKRRSSEASRAVTP